MTLTLPLTNSVSPWGAMKTDARLSKFVANKSSEVQAGKSHKTKERSLKVTGRSAHVVALTNSSPEVSGKVAASSSHIEADAADSYSHVKVGNARDSTVNERKSEAIRKAGDRVVLARDFMLLPEERMAYERSSEHRQETARL